MLRGAAACAAGAALIWWSAFHVDVVQRLDRTMVSVAMDIYQSPPDDLMRWLLSILTGPVYGALCVGVLAVGLYLRRWFEAAAGALIIAGTNLLAQALQPAASTPRWHERFISEGLEWPSGHAAAATALAFAAVVISPPDRRSQVAKWSFGAAGIVCLSIVMSHAHFLTDVLGAMAIAGAVGLTAMAAIARRQPIPRRPPEMTPAASGTREH